MSSPLFDLGTERLVQQKVSFPTGGPDQTPGVIVMRLDDTLGPNVDPALKGLVVVFNASDDATTQMFAATAGQRYDLHPVQGNGSDPVPARTVAVFVQR